MDHLSIGSYNVHGCRGLDRRLDPGRIARIIGEMTPDIIGLQEIYASPGTTSSYGQFDLLKRTLGFDGVHGATVRRSRGFYGNGLLTTGRIQSVRRVDLSFRRMEPRGALDVDVEIKGRVLRVVVTHLGLLGIERRYQIKRLLQYLSERPAPATVVLGDLNEWLPRSRSLRWMHSHMGKTPSPRTFPSPFPIFRLDRIWMRPLEALLCVEVHDTPAARSASDHLPILARIVHGTL